MNVSVFDMYGISSDHGVPGLERVDVDCLPTGPLCPCSRRCLRIRSQVDSPGREVEGEGESLSLECARNVDRVSVSKDVDGDGADKDCACAEPDDA